MKPAARIGDMHVCPMVTPGTPPIPHVGGPITVGEPTVLIGMMPAARLGDMCTCVGPPDVIAMGSPTVLIGMKPAARMGDPTAHGGMISVGCPTVLIGESASGGGGAGPGGGGGGPGGGGAPGVGVAKKGLAVKSLYDAGKLGARTGNSAIQGAKHGQNLFQAGGRALLRGTKGVPWLAIVGAGVSAYDGASKAPEGEKVQGAIVQVAKDNKYAMGGAAVGAAIGAWGFGVGAVPGAAVGFAVGGVADAISTLLD